MTAASQRTRGRADYRSLGMTVREGGLEPPSLSAPDPKSGASASSATPASRRKVRVKRTRGHSQLLGQSAPASHKTRGPGDDRRARVLLVVAPLTAPSMSPSLFPGHEART